MTKKTNTKSTKKDLKLKTEQGFKTGDHVVYPSHGVGLITGVETNKIGGTEFSFLAIYFDKEKLAIKVPLTQIKKIGVRTLATKAQMDEVFDILQSGVKKLKGMWSRRAQEYESKINSGDIVLLAEVIRDLTRDIDDSERSYSERIIYETAIYRLASEYAAINKLDFEDAKSEIISTARNKIAQSAENQGAEIINIKDFDDDFDFDDNDIGSEADNDNFQNNDGNKTNVG